MTHDAARTRVAERLVALRLADDRLDGTLEGITAGSGIPNTAIDSAPLEVIAAARAGTTPFVRPHRTPFRRHTSRLAGPPVRRRRSSPPAASWTRARRATSPVHD